MRFTRASSVVVIVGLSALLSNACGGADDNANLGGGATGGLGGVPSGGLGGLGISGALNSGGVPGSAGGGPATSGGAPAGGAGGVGTAGGAAGASNPDAGAGGAGDAGVEGGAPVPCESNPQCVSAGGGKKFCDAAAGVCVECHVNADCPATAECKDSACVPLKECTNSLGCAGATDGRTICDTAAGACVQCTAPTDCAKEEICAGRTCRTGCTSDNQCTGKGLLCNKALGGICTQCVATKDCAAKEYCELGTCVPDTCVAGQKSCLLNSVVTCNAEGSNITASACGAGARCIEAAGSASCVAIPKDDGGAGPGADAGTDAGAGDCKNRRRDGEETGVDCGGPSCPKCPNNDDCELARDCTSGVCDYCSTSPLCVFQTICLAPTCTDSVRNGSETDVDCGGPTNTRTACPRCDGAKTCRANSDCLSAACTRGKCEAPKCVAAECAACTGLPFPRTSCCTAADACGCKPVLGGACQ